MKRAEQLRRLLVEQDALIEACRGTIELTNKVHQEAVRHRAALAIELDLLTRDTGVMVVGGHIVHPDRIQKGGVA